MILYSLSGALQLIDTKQTPDASRPSETHGRDALGRLRKIPKDVRPATNQTARRQLSPRALSRQAVQSLLLNRQRMRAFLSHHCSKPRRKASVNQATDSESVDRVLFCESMADAPLPRNVQARFILAE